MKKIALAIVLVLFAVVCHAQANFYKIGFGGGAGGNYTFTDLEKGAFSYSGYVAADYYITPFITAGLEGQFGSLKSKQEPDNNGRMFSNSYTSFGANVKVRLGQFTDFYYNEFLNLTKGFYVGVGAALTMNNVSAIRTKYSEDNGVLTSYTFPGVDKGKDFTIPLNVGIDFHFFDAYGSNRYILNFNLQNNFVTGDNLDGYNDPPPFKNNSADFYTFLSVGFKYNFGPVGLANKTVR